MAEVEGQLPSDAKQEQTAAEAGSRARGGNRPAGKEHMHPLIELTLTRVREFIREPEAVFWVFVFPVLLACALGIAFRSTTPQKIRIAIEDDGQTAQVNSILATLQKSPDINPIV